MPIKLRATANNLPSCSIDKSSLVPPEDVIWKYPKLKGESKAGKLAVKLAKEAFFGDEILIQCAVSGCRDLPALPVQKLTELKQMILMQFPKFWNSPQEFEQLWTRLVPINYAQDFCNYSLLLFLSNRLLFPGHVPIIPSHQ